MSGIDPATVQRCIEILRRQPYPDERSINALVLLAPDLVVIEDNWRLLPLVATRIMLNAGFLSVWNEIGEPLVERYQRTGDQTLIVPSDIGKVVWRAMSEAAPHYGER